jgi:type 1 glutamine amidotransferase
MFPKYHPLRPSTQEHWKEGKANSPFLTGAPLNFRHNSQAQMSGAVTRGAALLLFALFVVCAHSESPKKPFKVLAIAEPGGIHKPFVVAAKIWLAHEAMVDGFTVDYIENTDTINDAFLSQYTLFLQLNYPPYAWTPTAMAAFQKFIEEGRGGWIGFHHATLLGEFDGYPMWPWFSTFMGGIRFKTYISTFVSGRVKVEAPSHPVMQGIAGTFQVDSEEWYTYDKSPRSNVYVLASVEESTYSPSTLIKMGDHPVVWTNEHVKARNLYIFMGHHGELFQNSSFTTLFHNSIVWAAGK